MRDGGNILNRLIFKGGIMAKEPYDSEKHILRPRVNRYDELNKLAEELKSTPTAIVNFCVEVGIEVLSRSKDEMIKHFKDVLKNKLE